MPPRLRGAGVVLRPLCMEDIETVRLWRNRDDVRRWFKTSSLISPEEQQRWFREQQSRERDFIWIIEDARQPGVAAGQISLYGFDEEHRQAELGRLIAAPEARGKGHMASACRALIRHSFDDLDLDSLRLEVFGNNLPALRLYKKCGFRVDDDTGALIRMRLHRSWPEALRPVNPPHPARITWVASYPHSGGAFLRAFLRILLHADRSPFDIRHMPVRVLNAESASRHGNERALKEGAPDFAAVYIVRNPCEIAALMAAHRGIALDKAADRLLGRDSTPAKHPERILSWQQHVTRWLTARMSIHVMRYDDIKRQPLKCFREAVRFLGYDHADIAISSALEITASQACTEAPEARLSGRHRDALAAARGAIEPLLTARGA